MSQHKIGFGRSSEYDMIDFIDGELNKIDENFDELYSGYSSVANRVLDFGSANTIPVGTTNDKIIVIFAHYLRGSLKGAGEFWILPDVLVEPTYSHKVGDDCGLFDGLTPFAVTISGSVVNLVITPDSSDSNNITFSYVIVKRI